MQPDRIKDLRLPFARTLGIRELALFPRIGGMREAQRVMLVIDNKLDKPFFDRGNQGADRFRYGSCASLWRII